MMIYSGADTEAFLNEGDSDYLLVTFNEISFIANGSRYWGKPLIERNRINAIGIASRTPSWFLPSEISDICNRSRPILDRFKGRIVLSGHSMGAYGAIKYSGLFGASTVVATVPQYTIDRSILENDPRPPNPYFHPGRHRGMHPRPHELSGEIFIFCDLGHFERPHFDKYMALDYPRKHIFHVPYTDHELPRIFAREERFLRLIELCRHGGEQEIRRFLRESRIGADLRIVTIAQRLAPRRPDLALKLYHAHRQKFTPVYMSLLARALGPSRAAEAREIAREAVALAPKLAGLPQISALLAAQGRTGEAGAMAPLAPLRRT
jgi:hypothetical protein